jgi:hypothetical protein
VKKNKILLWGTLITGLLTCSSLLAQEFLPPAAPKVRLCVRMAGDDGPGSYMRKFSYMVSGGGSSAADFFRLEAGQRLYVADLDVTQPGMLKIQEDGNANFNCEFPIQPDTRSIDVTINSPPGVQDCAIQTFTTKHACHL